MVPPIIPHTPNPPITKAILNVFCSNVLTVPLQKDKENLAEPDKNLFRHQYEAVETNRSGTAKGMIGLFDIIESRK
jgi:hypothetical protein